MYPLLGFLADYIGLSCPAQLHEKEFHSVFLYNCELDYPVTALCICKKDDLPVNATLVLCCDAVDGMLCGDGSMSPTEMFSMCCNYLMYHTKIEASKSRLCNALLSGKGINYLISEAALVLNNPIIVADNSFAIIASSGADKFSDTFLQDIVQNGCYPENYIKHTFRHNAVISTSIEIDPPIQSDKYSPKRYMSVDLMIKGKYVGFATMVEENPFKESDNTMFAYLCRIIVTELKSTNHDVYASRSDSEYVLMELLNGTLSGSRLNTRLVQAGIDFKNPKRLIVFRRHPQDYSAPRFEFFINEFQRQLSNCPCVIYSDAIVCLLDSNIVNEERFKDVIMKMLEFSGFVCGISDDIDSAIRFNSHYSKAVTAIILGETMKHNGPIYNYNEYYLFHMLSLVHDRSNLAGFCSSKFMSLIKYDKENKTAYSETLASYLACTQDSLLTAEAMHVHRNTIIYRIKRLEDTFKINFKDAQELFSIQLTIQILKYLRNTEPL